ARTLTGGSKMPQRHLSVFQCKGCLWYSRAATPKSSVDSRLPILRIIPNRPAPVMLAQFFQRGRRQRGHVRYGEVELRLGNAADTRDYGADGGVGEGEFDGRLRQGETRAFQIRFDAIDVGHHAIKPLA